MSWWVTDYIAVSEDETQQLCNIQADAVSDLPAQDQTTTAGFTFVRGSKADVLATSGKYIMNSQGNWVLQKSGHEIEIGADDIVYDNTDSGMTATNVQDAIDEIKDLDDMQDRALAELYGENANQQLEIDYAINTGAKNLLKITASSQTISGVTFTVNDDQTITVNGTATATSIFVVTNNATAIQIPDGQYVLTGCPTGGGINAYDLRWYLYSTGSSAYDYGSGAAISKTGNTTTSNIAIVVRSGQTVNNLIFKPMIRPAEITSSTYVPYAPTNRELYELCETKASLNDIYGIKNQLPNGTDLNNLTAGCMTCSGATVAATLINCPTTTDAFIIYTDYLAVTSRVIQRIYSFNTTTGIPSQYMRVRWSQGWTPWYQVAMQQVASASTQSVNQVSTLNLSRNDLNESLDTDFDLTDSTPEEEEGEEDD